MAICPFHDDRTPSLLIDTSREKDRQHFHCFACGEHGTALDLVKNRLDLDFNAAVDWLATTFGITARLQINQEGREESRLSGLEEAYRIYTSESKDDLLAEWAKSRNFDFKFIKNCGLTYAAAGTLASKSKTANIGDDSNLELLGVLEDNGLIRKVLPTVGTSLHILTGSDVQYVDTFTGDRVIIPIRDHRKKIVGLAARAAGPLSSLQKAKYLLSKNFPKSQTLYRSETAFSRVREWSKNGQAEIALYVCEGFLDALRLESLGQAAVAVMGAALTKDQIDLLKELSEGLPNKKTTLTIMLCFDRDEAGLKGAAKSTLMLLDAGLDVTFLWPSNNSLKQKKIPIEAKDPDAYLAGLTSIEALELISQSIHSSGLSILANHFGISTEEILDSQNWALASPSRKFRAFEKAFADFRKVRLSNSARILQWMGESNGEAAEPIAEWINYFQTRALSSSTTSELYLTNSTARLNHARLLAYRGSRRGELACDEPKWERLDVAATAFNVLLKERIDRQITAFAGAFDAVFVPRSFGGDEPRLKVMPQPEDLIIQQYLLNDLLTERWDSESIGHAQFSQCIPAVRYYREEHKTITTGLTEKTTDPERMVRHGPTLSFAYQIDMDVLEGRQPASDQGMFRPYSECWHEFMQSLKSQSKAIGHVHAIRLDVSRYYDRIRRSVMRDALQGKIQSAFESIPGDAPGFASPIINAHDDSPATRAATIVDQLGDLMFGYPYYSPETGLMKNAEPARGIPQGPVISAWIGTITLFSVDQVAADLMEKYNTDGVVRLGYARYVDDIVLLAENALLLEELRDAVDARTRLLDLTLVAKADSIPPMTADEFSSYINEGRMLDASGPTWLPPIVGDGEAGWEFWSATPSSDRQSALQLLSNLELYKSSAQTIVNTVRTAFLATDLRASELAKGARLLWYATAISLPADEQLPVSAARAAWERFKEYWSICTDGAGWQLNPTMNGWEEISLFALEGLEKLIDHTATRLRGLSIEEDNVRQQRIVRLSAIANTPDFKNCIFTGNVKLVRQTNRRFELLQWKAAKATGQPHSDRQYIAERSQPVQEWHAFEWFHAAIERLASAEVYGAVDPLMVFTAPYDRENLRAINIELDSFKLFGYLLPRRKSTRSDEVSEHADFEYEARLISCALQTLAAVVPKDIVLTLLTNRPHLLKIGHIQNFMFMPPLPGIEQRRLIACQLTTSPANESQVAALSTFEFAKHSSDEVSLDFLGVRDGVCITLKPDWKTESGNGEVVVRREAPVMDSFLRVRIRPQSDHVENLRLSLHEAARLYRKITTAALEFANQNPGYEIVPAWPYIAFDKNTNSMFLLSEGVRHDEVGNRAFVRDGARALRTVEVPIYEAYLWRAGMALTDYLGFSDDITKFKSLSSDLPFDESGTSALALYVLRTQCRKLRGVYADSHIARRVRKDSSLPATIERSLELLEKYPENGDINSQLKYVLATEFETTAMRLRLQEQQTLDTQVFLVNVASSVFSRLPVSIGAPLARDGSALGNLRRDFAGVLNLSRSVWKLPEDAADAQVVAWHALRAGLVGLAIKVGISGLITSLRSHPEFTSIDSFDFPVEWEIPSSSDKDRANAGIDAKNNSTKSSSVELPNLLELLRQLVKLLAHRLRSSEKEGTSLPKRIVDRIRQLATDFAKLACAESEVNKEAAWPFIGVTDLVVATLNIQTLETVEQLVLELDAELSIQVLLVKEQTYGFNAQTRRFTDSRNRTWELKPSMISQFPMRAKGIEEDNSEGRILRIWSEVIDTQTGRLLSVSVLGEPFASMAISKSIPDVSETLSTLDEAGLSRSDVKPSDKTLDEQESNPVETLIDERKPESTSSTEKSSSAAEKRENVGHDVNKDSKARTHRGMPIQSRARAFRRRQQDEWSRRADAKNPAHVRVAVLQLSIDLSYAHPICEVSPKAWPFSESCKREILKTLDSPAFPHYQAIGRATANSSSGHYWNFTGVSLPSWAEHRRRRFLERAVNSCEDFGVDLLVLPEYSIRPETVEWLQEYLKGKRVSLLAGTYMQFSEDARRPRCSANLSLLWPIPEDILTGAESTSGAPSQTSSDALTRNEVLRLERTKKYRSVGLSEFLRPSSAPLNPLFNPANLIDAISTQHELKLSNKGIIKLLAETRLPLRHFLELICSEIFLLTSPANYSQIAKDYVWAHRRFGGSAEEAEVWEDIKLLSQHLSFGSKEDGTPPRTVTVVPAATTRTADYWIAGQAALLAAGTTTVFCNGAGHGLKGGSCFIGRESWKGIDGSTGYISSITPYHGWSKGIYYNSKQDPLSEDDQALIIADLDPVHMIEGKPRPQLLPVPLQLVAYLPIAEIVNTSTLNEMLYRSITVESEGSQAPVELDDLPPNVHDFTDFWEVVSLCEPGADKASIKKFSEFFADPRAIRSRLEAAKNDGGQQPCHVPESSATVSSPAFFDWLDVDLSIDDGRLPKVSVPPWR